MRSGQLRRALLFLGAGAGLLAGCSLPDYIKPTKYSFFTGEDVNLIEVNYAAADYIVGQARSNINRHTLILTDQLRSLNHPDAATQFGTLIPEQVGARISQLGYRVQPRPRQDGLSPPPPSRHALLTGTYLYSETDLSVTINLRLVDSETGQIMGAHDYIIPVNREINDLIQPRPTAIRMTQ